MTETDDLEPEEDQKASGPGPERPPEVPEGQTRNPIWHFLFGSGTRISVTVAITLFVIGTAITLSVSSSSTTVVKEIGRGGQSNLVAPPSSIQSASDLQQYLLSRPIWQVPPTVFPASLNFAFNRQSVSGGPQLGAVSSGQAEAYSVPSLVSNGASLAGEPIYVVGRVSSDVDSPVDTSNWNTEPGVDLVLEGRSGPDRAYALASSGVTTVQAGDVVYFRAVVAATGTGTDGRPTVYLIGVEDPDETSNAFGAGDTVASLAKQFGGGAVAP